MPNKNYIKGKNYEQELVRTAKKDGFLAFRSAGSHSPIDVVIIDDEAKIIWLIQAKTGAGNYTKLEKEFRRNQTGYRVFWKLMHREEDGTEF